MNIFMLDIDPVLCAQYHNDRHVVKMILESCQLLSTAHRVLDGKQYIPISGRKTIRWKLSDQRSDIQYYQATHINHPCAIWCRESIDHYKWLWKLTVALSDEYTFRYGKVHKCRREGLLDSLVNPPKGLTLYGWNSPAQAMPGDCRSYDAIEAYRKYYCIHKKHIATWKNRSIPSWWLEYAPVGQ